MARMILRDVNTHVKVPVIIGKKSFAEFLNHRLSWVDRLALVSISDVFFGTQGRRVGSYFRDQPTSLIPYTNPTGQVSIHRLSYVFLRVICVGFRTTVGRAANTAYKHRFATLQPLDAVND